MVITDLSKPHTDRGVEVVVPGKEYRPYCNKCRWESVRKYQSIPDASAAGHECNK